MRLITFEHGADVPDGDTALAGHLADAHLQEKDRYAAGDQADEVGYEEGACKGTGIVVSGCPGNVV